MGSMKQAALLLLTILFFLPVTAMATEALRFRNADSYKEKQIIQFIEKTNKTSGIPYLIAPIDLNNDAIDEYIIKPASTKYCVRKPLCSHQITAFRNRFPLLIGEFDAHKMVISNKKAYGIRHIIVYNVPHNDFKSETATWSPFNFRFELP